MDHRDAGDGVGRARGGRRLSRPGAERRDQPDRAGRRAAGSSRAGAASATCARSGLPGWSAAPRSWTSRHRPDGVSLSVRTTSDGRARRVHARYLIAADGVRSTCCEALWPSRASRRELLGERLAVLFRAPLWELVGEHRYVIYLLDRARPARRVRAGGPPGPLGVRGRARTPHTRGSSDSTAELTAWIRDRRRRSGPRAGHRARRDRRSSGSTLAERFRRGQRVPDRRRGPPRDPARRHRPEHRDPRRLRPRLEARLGAARLGGRGAARLATRPSGVRWPSTTPRARPTRRDRFARCPRSCAPTSAAGSPTCGCRARRRGSRRSTCSGTASPCSPAAPGLDAGAAARRRPAGDGAAARPAHGASARRADRRRPHRAPGRSPGRASGTTGGPSRPRAPGRRDVHDGSTRFPIGPRIGGLPAKQPRGGRGDNRPLEESPDTAGQGGRGTDPGKPAGKCHRNTPPMAPASAESGAQARVKRCGKSAPASR